MCNKIFGSPQIMKVSYILLTRISLDAHALTHLLDDSALPHRGIPWESTSKFYVLPSAIARREQRGPRPYDQWVPKVSYIQRGGRFASYPSSIHQSGQEEPQQDAKSHAKGRSIAVRGASLLEYSTHGSYQFWVNKMNHYAHYLRSCRNILY